MEKVKVIVEVAEHELALDENGYVNWDFLRNELMAKEMASSIIDSKVQLTFGNLIENVINKDGNTIFSPAALYAAIAILSQITANETKKQIIDVLGVEDEKIQTVYEAVKKISESLNGEANCQMSESIWINKNMHYNADLLKALNETFGVSSYEGEMGSEDMDAAISSWINKSTGNLLKNDMDVKTKSDMLLDLFSTICFGAKWENMFWQKARKSDFKFEDGETVKCLLMSGDEQTDYHVGKKFKAVTKSLGGDYKAIFVLPDEGVRVDELVNDSQVIDLACSGHIDTTKICDVSMTIPKFEVSSKLDLKVTLQNLGIKDAFSMDNADYTPVSDAELLYMSKAEQTTRIKVDEEGVIAASCVELGIACGCVPPEYEKVKIKVDRPFLFFVVASDTLPIIAGKIMNPNDN